MCWSCNIIFNLSKGSSLLKLMFLRSGTGFLPLYCIVNYVIVWRFLLICTTLDTQKQLRSSNHSTNYFLLSISNIKLKLHHEKKYKQYVKSLVRFQNQIFTDLDIVLMLLSNKMFKHSWNPLWWTTQWRPGVITRKKKKYYYHLVQSQRHLIPLFNNRH